MPNKCLVICLILLAMVAVTACQPPPPPPPPTPPPPPEPTPDQHAENARKALGPLLGESPLPPGGQSALDPLVSAFSGVKGQLSATENGRGGLAIIQREVEDTIKKMRDQARWRKVRVLCDVYKVLQPGSDRYAKLERDAELMMAKPEVVSTGFVQTGADLYAFLEVSDPINGGKETFKVREGEEFYRPAKLGNQPNSSEVLRMVRIIGNQQEVEIEYKPANFLWQIPGPRTRDK